MLYVNTFTKTNEAISSVWVVMVVIVTIGLFSKELSQGQEVGDTLLD